MTQDEDDMTPDTDAMLAAEFAMGLLEGDELSAFEARLAGEPDLLAEVHAWNERFAHMVNDVAEMPPGRVKHDMQRKLFGEPRDERSFKWMWQVIGGLGFAAAALVVAGFFFLFSTPNEGPVPGVVLAAEVVAEDDSLRLLAVYSGDAGELRLTRTHGAARDGRALELWLIAGGNAPVSLGVLPVDASARIVVPEALRAAMVAGTLAVSDEPLGGSTTGAPTGDVLAVGAVTTL